jgi:hypothetical protein
MKTGDGHEISLELAQISYYAELFHKSHIA